ncbi:putative WW domain protein [Toxoplasma gondii TgCatPRC2]|uniref:Formin binding protein, putative n=13 Tax=Toxoplasma gondii TaxID=5811 RepID=A0A125YQ81_TOXGV|nr:hypothetical protein TGME49_306220 [Toxoplasma gondii ME49]EPR57485.1 hypothetical protein TGGT1_306220 [Toxoplasma gondii GT1]ESS29002.1 putative WW domain protein [Toxoplasma gondii VEG]KAF4644773.1 hypothetical protein TGRH88_017670 [Toxoplasma gondii]KFG33477.1 putative WW domain protein [Toxoplasma gondii GAB2-2007-GAL-DOM2]KFG45022.1 putative WW domain protein [Toxoplasma gondii FOU]KFG59323.1 putative WW domain protein [Toxoplasma gondii RUB]KFH02687.1 putative WW domain protein [T|eukprot:XP_018636161.1 hypothetical protein TGME49_306220 [Toxoplasma gondii ME49]
MMGGGDGAPPAGGLSFPSASAFPPHLPSVLPSGAPGVSDLAPPVLMNPGLMGLALGLGGAPTAVGGAFGAQPGPRPSGPEGKAAEAAGANGWTEHVGKDGRRYYYNAATQQSQWEKPEAMMTEEEKKVYNKLGWIKYSTAEGKEYWFSSYTKKSTWTTPKEVDEYLKQLEEEKEEWPKFTNKTEARRWIVKLFELKKFPPRINWENAVKFLETDKRWESFKILTRGERKQSFSEFMSQRQKKTADSTRKKRQEARDALAQALQNWEELAPGTTYIAMADKMHEQEWWTFLTEQERDDFFQDYMEEFDKRHRELFKKKRKKDVETVEKILDKRSAEFDYRRKWVDVRDELFAIPELSTVLRLDILQVWENWVEHGYADERRNRRHVVFRRERKRRDAFRSLLDEAAKKGELTAKTEWPDFVAQIVNDPRYYQMVGQGGSTPRELFEDAVDNLKEEYQRQKPVILDCLKRAGLELDSPSLTFEEFYSALCTCEGMKGVSLMNAKLTFESLTSPARDRGRSGEHGAASGTRNPVATEDVSRRESTSPRRTTACRALLARETKETRVGGHSGSATSSRRRRDSPRGRDRERETERESSRKDGSSSSSSYSGSSLRGEGRGRERRSASRQTERDGPGDRHRGRSRSREGERKRRRSHASSRSSSPRGKGRKDDGKRKRRH